MISLTTVSFAIMFAASDHYTCDYYDCYRYFELHGGALTAVLLCFPKFLGTYLCIRWFCSDDKEGRRGMKAACVIDVIFYLA